MEDSVPLFSVKTACGSRGEDPARDDVRNLTESSRTVGGGMPGLESAIPRKGSQVNGILKQLCGSYNAEM